MAGIGDSWGTREELLHPRGPDGRWIKKAGIRRGALGRILDALGKFRPRMFQSPQQSSQFLKNVSTRNPGRFRGGKDYGRLLSDLGPTNEDLRDGVIDNPSTQRFVSMMDQSATELPDDVILTRYVGVEAFGFTPQTAQGTDSENNPGIRGLSGQLVADRGYSTTTIGGPRGTPAPGSVRMVIAAQRGTKVVVPGAGQNDQTVFLDRDQRLRVTKIEPDGTGGWVMYAITDSKSGRTPIPIGGPIGDGTRDTKQREAAVREVGRIQAAGEKRPDEVAEQADIEQRRVAAEEAKNAPVTLSPTQEADRRRIEQLQQQAGVQPRTEPIQARSIGGEPRPETAPGGAPQTQAPGAPEATAPRRAVDLRLAVRDAGIPAPAAGPNRKRFNDAYEGVISGKKDPIDAARELDRDAADLEAAGDADADNLRQLSDVIKREYGLEGPAPAKKAAKKAAPVPRTAQGLPKLTKSQMQELDEREAARKAGKAAGTEAVPTPTPAPAPAKKAAKKAAGPTMTRDQEDRVIARARQFRANPRNEEEQRIVDTADRIIATRQGRAPAAAPSKAAKAAPAAAPQPTSEADLDKMTKNELLAEANKRGVTVSKSWNKDKIKAALSDTGPTGVKRDESQHTGEKLERLEPGPPTPIRRPDLLPEGEELDRRRREAEALQREQEAAQPRDLDKMTKRELIEEAGRRGVTARESWSKDKIKAEIRRREELADESDAQFRRDMAEELNAEFEDERQLEQKLQEEEALARAPAKKAPAKKAAKAAVPGAAPGTAAGKITAGRLKAGDQVLVTQNNAGDWVPSTRKTGQTRLTIEGIGRGEGRSGLRRTTTRLILTGRDENGNEIKVASVPGHQTFIVAPEPGAAPAKAAKAAAPDGVQVARARQEEIFEAKRFSDTAAELDQLIADEASDKAILARFDNVTQNEGTTGSAMNVVRARLEAGDRAGAHREMRRILEANRIQPTGSAGDIVPFNRREHAEIAGTNINDGDMVRIVRPGHRVDIRGEQVDLGRSVVERATPEEVRTSELGKRLVPEGSVAGPRTGTPVGNAPRKREFTDAWDAADLQGEGAAGRAMKEIRDDVASGKLTPEEGIRRLESEIAFNQEDLNEVDANLRQPDLTDADRTRLQSDAAKLQNAIDSQKQASKFMRLYFKDEKQTVKEVQIELGPEEFKTLNDASVEDLREAAKIGGLDPPKGETKDEVLQDMVIQVARKVAQDKGITPKKVAKKAAKKAAPPAVPKERERVDVRLIGAGLDLSENDGWVKDRLDEAQRDLDEGKSPAEVGRKLEFKARGLRDHASIQYGKWTDHIDAGQEPPDAEELARRAERDETLRKLRADADGIEALAERLKKTRRKPVKKAAPATPEVAKLQDKVDDLEKRRIDDALGELSQSGDNRDRADAVLENLTMSELRRLADQSGVENARTKRKLRDNILDRFVPRPEVTLDQFRDLPSREAAEELLAPLGKPALLRLARELSVPGAGSKNMTELRREIVEGTTGARLDSIAIRGFKGARPGLGDVQGRPDLPTVGTPAARPKTLSVRARDAGITHPGETFSDVDSAVGDADRRLQGGESPTAVAKSLRERAARVAKADINEEGRRFRTEKDKDSLLSIRKQSAEYLRRVATHVQQEGKTSAPAKKAPVKKAAPELPPGQFLELARAERPFTGPAKEAPSPSRTGTSPVGGTKPEGSPLPDSFKRRTTDSRGTIIRRDRPNADEPLHLPNGGSDQGRMHLDSEFGELWQVLYQDDREPNSFVNEIARMGEQVGTGQLPLAQALERLARMKDQATDQTVANRIQRAIDAMDAPPVTVPDLPDTVPASVREALRRLSEIPTARSTKVRGIGRGEPSVFDRKLDIIRRLEAGDEERRLDAMLRERNLHESVDGALEMWRLFENIPMKELMQWRRDAYRRAHPEGGGPPTPTKSTPRLTAIPGGKTGEGRSGKRPKLTVVRNDEGQFTLAWT